MSPVDRTISGAVLRFDLAEEMRIVRSELDAGHSRIARTLVKEGLLRVILIGVRPGGSMHEHVAEGPITIHALEGNVVVRTEADAKTLPPGGLIALDGGIRHDVSSDEGGFFLLTLVGSGRSHASEAPLGSDQTRSL